MQRAVGSIVVDSVLRNPRFVECEAGIPCPSGKELTFQNQEHSLVVTEGRLARIKPCSLLLIDTLGSDPRVRKLGGRHVDPGGTEEAPSIKLSSCVGSQESCIYYLEELYP